MTRRLPERPETRTTKKSGSLQSGGKSGVSIDPHGPSAATTRNP